MAEAYWTGESTAWGNLRVSIGTITLSGLASGAALPNGAGYIRGGIAKLRSGTECNSYSVSWNERSGATADSGWIHIGSGADGDVFDIIAWGS